MLPWCEKDLAHLAEAGSAGDDPRQLPNATADATVLFSFFLKFFEEEAFTCPPICGNHSKRVPRNWPRPVHHPPLKQKKGYACHGKPLAGCLGAQSDHAPYEWDPTFYPSTAGRSTSRLDHPGLLVAFVRVMSAARNQMRR